MQASARLGEVPGVLEAAVVMATPLNQDVLRSNSLLLDEALAVAAGGGLALV